MAHRALKAHKTFAAIVLACEQGCVTQLGTRQSALGFSFPYCVSLKEWSCFAAVPKLPNW
jgi:hypothetical protein